MNKIMKSPVIHFAHANGFPASTYQALFSRLKPTFEIQAIDQLAHDPTRPVTDNWQSITEELIESLEKKQLGPVIGIGHSLGGSITLLAAIERPELFQYLILLDTPIFAYHRSKIIQLFKRLGRAEWITPGGRTRRRRAQWSSRKEALAYFRTRPLFRHFTEECLEDYVNYGLENNSQGVGLRFHPSIEAQIFLTLPHHYHNLKGKLQVPGIALVGETSKIVKPSDIRSLHKNFNIDSHRVPGGHLFPFEHPEVTANVINDAIRSHLECS